MESMTPRTAALCLLTCSHCGGSFAVVKRAGGGRYPATCSEACKRARGPHGDVRLTRNAATRTGVLDPGDWSARHGGVSAADAVLAQAFGEGTGEGQWSGWHVTAGHYPLYDEAGRLLRDADGRVLTKFRNWSAQAVDVPAVDSRVIGQPDLPHDWQERLSAGESIESITMRSWLGVGLADLAVAEVV